MTNRKPRVLKGYLMPFETLKQAEEYVETNTDLVADIFDRDREDVRDHVVRYVTRKVILQDALRFYDQMEEKVRRIHNMLGVALALPEDENYENNRVEDQDYALELIRQALVEAQKEVTIENYENNR